jgi:hypothetical protein
MKNIIKINALNVGLLISLVFTSGCYYDEVVPPEGEDVKDVSFSTQVEPIFYTAEKCTSCHTAGGSASFLDLSQGNAFASLNDPKYIDVASPTTSLIYTKPAPGEGHFKTYTADEAKIVEVWIAEGAEDN